MTTLKGIFSHPEAPRKKNFLHENVKNIRQMEKHFHTTKEFNNAQKLQLHRSYKYQNVVPRVHSSLHNSAFVARNVESTDIKLEGQSLNRKSSAPAISTSKKTRKINSRSVTTPLKREKQRKIQLNDQTTDKNLSKALLDLNINKNSPVEKETTSQGCQTTDFDRLSYSEDMIRYPSTSSTQRKSPSPIDKTLSSNSPPNRGDDIQKINYIKLNKEKSSIPAKTTSPLKNCDLPANYKKGTVPKYIQERKEEQHKKELEKAKDEVYYADCPDGHIPLPENERKETLRMLKQNYQGFVDELNKMPIRSDTLRSQTRKMEIEKQLSKLEEGIKVFSRSKVFVKINS